jgi:hypothetical protein
MRKLILLLLLFVHIIAQAQYSYDKRFCVLSKFNTSIPLSDFSTASGKQSEIGPMRMSSGGGFSVGVPVYKGLVFSFSLQYEAYPVNKSAILQIYKDRYNDSKYYTNVLGSPRFQTACPALELSYRIRIRSMELEPYFRAGLGYAQVQSNIKIERKLQNDHYKETYDILPDETSFFFPNIGANFNVPIFKWFYGVVSTGYGFGKFDMNMTEYKKDYWGSETKNKYVAVQQKISAIQFQVGLQLRMGHYPKNPSKTDETKH